MTEHEQILLLRYIYAEKKEPDFIAHGHIDKFLLEIFFYFYYAGHGCSDERQWIVLNEREVSKIFWPAEERIKLILGQCGSNSKSLAVFDCCREAKKGAIDRVIEAHKKIEELTKKESLEGNNQ